MTFFRLQKIKGAVLGSFGFFVLSFFVCSTGLKAQDTTAQRSFFISGNFLQLKEASNYGLVFRGPAADAGFSWEKTARNHFFKYENHLGIGILFSKSIAGINFSLKPVDLCYIWDLPVIFIKLRAGPGVKMQYDAQFYPDLQSGFDFWLTNFTTGIKVAAAIPAGRGTYLLSLYSSVAGFTSRTKPYEDPYFYDLGFGEILKDINSNLHFSGPNRFKNISIDLNYQFKVKPGLSVSYILDYSSYNYDSKLKYLNQSVRIIIKGKK